MEIKNIYNHKIFVSQNNILCVIWYKISKEFIPPQTVFYTAWGGSEKLTKLIFLGVPIEYYITKKIEIY